MTEDILTIAEQDIEELAAIREELATLLQGYTVRDLRTIGKARRFRLRGTRKADIVTQLVDFLSQRPNARAAIAELGADQRAVLDTLDLLGDAPGPTRQEVQRVVGTLHGADVTARLSDILGILFEQGLAFSRTEDYGMPRYVVPRVVRGVLEPLPDLVPAYLGSAKDLRVERDEGLPLVSAAYTIARLADTGSLALRPRPPLSAIERGNQYLQDWTHVPGELEALQRRGETWYWHSTESLTVPPPEPLLSDEALAEVKRRTGLDRDRADFLVHVLMGWQMLDAKTTKGAKRLVAHSDRVADFLQHGSVDRLRILYGGWAGAGDWSALNLVLRREKKLTLRRSVASYYFKPEHLYRDLARARHTVLRFLSRLVAGQWIDLDALGNVIRRVDPGLLQGSETHGHSPWWLDSAYERRRLDLKKPTDWRLGPGSFIRAMFAGPLRWLGLVDLGYDKTGLVAFLLTPLGACVLGRGVAPAAEDTGPILAVGQDHTVTVRAEAANAEVYRILDAVAELEAFDAHEFRYRFTAASVRRGFEAGLDASDVLSFLERSSGAPVPLAATPVGQALTDWQAHYGRLHVHDGLTLIEFDDDYALRELEVSTSIDQHLVRQFSPRLVAIDPASLDALLDEMVRAGHTPKVVKVSR